MPTDNPIDGPAPRAEAVIKQVMTDMAGSDHRAVVVDSPPGAGKSTLVVRAAGELVAGGERVMIVAQTNNQVDDLIRRLTQAHPGIPLGRLSGSEYQPTSEVSDICTSKLTLKDLSAFRIVVGTSAKWAVVDGDSFGWAILDEAYQMRSDKLLQIVGRFDRGLFVGDPGQLDPFTITESERWTGLPHDPTKNGVGVMLQHNPHTPVHSLPVSWRLPASASPVVQEAFYPLTEFTSGTEEGARSLRFRARSLGATALDETLEMAAATGWAFHELPRRHVPRTDGETIRSAADLATRLLDRGTTGHCEHAPEGRELRAGDIAIGVAHRDQADLVRAALRRSRNPEARSITVDNANRLQGREYEVMVVVHPLSGRRDATSFHLESGRLCVLTSRHRQACIVVGRAGIVDLLDSHPSTEPIHLSVPAKFPDGWQANQVVMGHLTRHRVGA
ncbi:AAA domain-containing protein [Nocardia sp. NPDC056952]|uniref:AAA domain-containing protein n=1 Tax=Nocardia sp. NPDC056952 TaxID=3345979 RepID=UPI0036432A95